MNETYLKEVNLRWDKVTDNNQYPFYLPAIKNLKKIKFDSQVTFFVGENGSGKSTLIEAIAISYGFNPEGGSKNFSFSTNDNYSNLNNYITLVKTPYQPKDGYFLRAESFYNLATEIDRIDPSLIKNYGGTSLHNMSHGESFLALFSNRFFGDGLYILDEPEAALSPIGQLALLKKVNDLMKTTRSQFIIATHSPILLALPGAQILEFSDTGINKVPYERTSHYQLYKRFLNGSNMVNDILDD